MYNSLNNPYNTLKEKSKFEMLQQARSDMMDSLDQIQDFDWHAYTATDKTAMETWTILKQKQFNILGQLMAMCYYLDPSEKEYVEMGMQEFHERMPNMNGRQFTRS